MDGPLKEPGGQDRLGWREFLERLDIPSAIISCTIQGPLGSSSGFLIGFDRLTGNLAAGQWLMAYAEDAWRRYLNQPVCSFRVADFGSSGSASRLPAIAPPDEVTIRDTIGQFDCAAAVQHVRPSASIRALLFRNGGSFSRAILQNIDNVLPLFLTSAAMQMAAAKAAQHAGLLEAMLERVAIAMILADEAGRPLFLNGAAKEMLASGDVLRLGLDGALVCPSAAETKKLRTAVQTAVAADRRNAPEMVLRLESEEDDAPRMGFILPALHRSAHGSVQCAMLLVHSRQGEDASKAMLEALGLLRSEQRFLSCFLHSSSLSEAASMGGLSEETARTYLKRIRAKLGVHRQMELARLIYGMSLPLRQPVIADDAAA
jgi:DNA-binding NarL/FixJ family response regulator